MDINGKPVQCTHCGSLHNRLYANTTDIEYFSTDKIYSYFLCNDCKVLFLHPQPIHELKTIYPPNYYSFSDESKSIAFRIKSWLDELFYKKQLSHLLQKELNILDIGGGTGLACDILKKTDKRIVHTQIVDIDAHAEKTAKQKGHNYFCGSYETFETNQLYDVILMLNLIEHVSNPEAVLKKATAQLSKNGIIIIQTPNYKSLDAALFRHRSWGGFHCPRHWIIFDKQGFLSLSDKCNLEPVSFRYTQGAAFWTVSILNQLHRWKWIQADANRPLIYHPLFGFISMITAAFDFVRKPFCPLSQMLLVLKHRENTGS